MKSILRSKLLFLLVALGYTLALLTASLIKIESESLPVRFEHADKLFHFGAYFTLTILWHLFYFIHRRTKEYHPYWVICLLAVVFGIIIEILQGSATTYRGFEWLDIVANTLGVVLASVALVVFNRFNHKVKIV